MRENAIPSLERITKEASFYNSLFASDDFQKFKKEVIDARIEGYFNIAKGANLATAEGRDAAIRALQCYQDLRAMFEDIFRVYDVAGKKAKEELSKLERSKQ